MTHKLLSSTVLILLVHSGTASGQETHNFSGSWRKDPVRSESALQTTAASAESAVGLVIDQSATSVRVGRQRRDGRSDVVTYVFNDLPAASAAPTLGGTTGTTVDQARAEWKDGRLLLRTAFSINGMAVTTIEAFTAVAGGNEIQVDTQIQMHHGYGGTDPEVKAGSNSRDIYVKTQR